MNTVGFAGLYKVFLMLSDNWDPGTSESYQAHRNFEKEKFHVQKFSIGSEPHF